MTREAVEAFENKGGIIRSAAAKFGIRLTSVASGVAGRVAVAARPGPYTVFTMEEEMPIEDLLRYAGRHLLGITRQRLWGNVCNNGNFRRGLINAWLKAFFKRHPRLTLRASRINKTNRVSANDRTRLNAFYDSCSASSAVQ